MTEDDREEALWRASERTRIGPTHLCHDVGNLFPPRGGTHKCSCGIGHEHREEDFWKWEAFWEPDEQWKGLWL